jgi:hypothetical protein
VVIVRTQVVLPFSRETKGTVVYGVNNLKSLAIGQVYVNKEHLEKVGGAWPERITLTIEPGDTTEEQTA